MTSKMKMIDPINFFQSLIYGMSIFRCCFRDKSNRVKKFKQLMK